MQLPKSPPPDDDKTLSEASVLLASSDKEVLLYRSREHGWCGISKDDLDQLIREGKGGDLLASSAEDHQVPSLHPDHPLDMALRYFDRWQLLPVVNRADLRKLEGVISQRDVLDRYRDFGGE